MLYIFSLMDSVLVGQVLEDVSVISVKITSGEIQMKNAMVSHISFGGGESYHEICQNSQQM